MMDRIVVVGASLAGTSAARTLRSEGFAGELTVVGDEAHPPYDRPPLSKEFLTGTKAASDLAIPGLVDLDIEWKLGVRAESVDLDRRVLRAAGATIDFDGMVIATGVRPRVLPGLEPNGEDVFALRTLRDSEQLRAALVAGRRLLVVGSGFIGVEVATSAREMGCQVTIVSLEAPLAVAGTTVSSVCSAKLEDLQVDVLTGCHVVSTQLDRDGARVALLDDGRRVTHDIVLVAVGSLPNVEWLDGNGLMLDDGVLCDEACAVVGFSDVVAAGDIARWPNFAFGGVPMRVEHWSNAIDQGAAAARTLLQGASRQTAFGSVPSFWSDHCGVRLQSVGLPHLSDSFELIDGSYEEHCYAVAAYRQGTLVGGQTYGIPRAMAQLRIQLAAQTHREATSA